MGTFDYLAPAGTSPQPGQRLRVPFRNGKRVGVVLATAGQSTLPASRLRRALEVLDPEPLLDAPLLALLDWASGYYQHPPGEVCATAMPRLLRHGRDADTGRPCYENCPLLGERPWHGWVHSRVLKAGWRGGEPIRLDCMLLRYVLPSTEQGTVSFITSMTEDFCAGCNRIRLTADGSIKSCLFSMAELNLRDPMRAGLTDEEVEARIRAALWLKPKGHPPMEELMEMDNRTMIEIGG
ncbi:MAG: hypothetical protein DYH19_03420 [Gammaproteobacteria bacterium PRO8]|nr:hypothetical protein [Gammaproteobacteria bacterium PRO8]